MRNEKSNIELKSDKKEKNEDKLNFNFFLKVLILPLLSLIIFASTIFGMVRIIGNGTIEQGEELQNRYEVQVHVDNLTDEYDINYVADYYVTQLNNLGLNSSRVSILDNDDILINFPVSSISNNNNDKFSYDTQNEFFKELLIIEGTLLNTSNIEFRSYTGDLLFNYDESGNEVIFYPPETSTESGSAESNPTYTEDEKLSEAYDTYDISLIQSASVEFINGQPYVEVQPKDEYLGMFNSGVNQMSELYDESTNPYGNFYTIWFSYDLFDFLASNFDSTAYTASGQSSEDDQVVESNLFSYIYYDENTQSTRSEPKNVSKPFYITQGRVEQTHSNYSNSFPIYGNFSLNEANAIANKINFSTHNFEISIVEQHFILKDGNINKFIVLIIFFSILFLLILIVSFFFVWWFGLLGAIVVLSSIIPGTVITVFVATFVISFGWILFTSMTIGYFIVALLQYKILKTYKDNISKNTSIFNKYKKNTKDFTLSTIFYIFIIFGAIAISSFLFPTLIQYYLLFIIAMIGVFYLFAYIFWMPMLTLFDTLFKYSFRDTNDNETWWIIVGKDTKIFEEFKERANILKKYDMLKADKKTTKTMITVALIILTFGFAAIILESSFVGVNKTFYNDDYYKYNVVRTVPLSIDDGYNDDKNDHYNQNELINEVNDNKDEIVNIFEDNGIKVKKTEIIRKENYSLESNEPLNQNKPSTYTLDYTFTYGLSLYSKDEMDYQTYLKINEDLASEDMIYQSQVAYKPANAKPFDEPTINYDCNFVLLDNASLNGISETNSAYMVNNYNFNKQIGMIVLGIIVFFVAMFLMLLLTYKWAIASSIILLAFLETTIVTLLMFLLFVPISIALFVAILTTATISVFSKITMIDKKKNGDTNIIYSRSFIPTVLMSLILFLNLFAFIFFGTAVLVSFIYFIIFMSVYTVINILFYPNMTKNLINLRDKHKENIKFKDEEWAKDSENISEEYIEGINK